MLVVFFAAVTGIKAKGKTGFIQISGVRGRHEENPSLRTLHEARHPVMATLAHGSK